MMPKRKAKALEEIQSNDYLPVHLIKSEPEDDEHLINIQARDDIISELQEELVLIDQNNQEQIKLNSIFKVINQKIITSLEKQKILIEKLKNEKETIQSDKKSLNGSLNYNQKKIKNLEESYNSDSKKLRLENENLKSELQIYNQKIEELEQILNNNTVNFGEEGSYHHNIEQLYLKLTSEGILPSKCETIVRDVLKYTLNLDVKNLPKNTSLESLNSNLDATISNVAQGNDVTSEPATSSEDLSSPPDKEV